MNGWNHPWPAARGNAGLLLLLLATRLAAGEAGASWWLAVDGDDAAAGTSAQPFATFARAQRAAAPGDTVFVRGGTYRLQEAQIAQREGIHARIVVLDKSGLPGRRITYRAAPGEEPVFDCAQVKPADLRVTAFHVSASWVHLDGLTVTGVQVTMTGHTQSICFENQGSDNVYERLRMHDGQAIGIYSLNGAHNLFLNCDAWSNRDSTSEDRKGGNVDGFGCHPTRGSTGNVFRGCRAWFNSDDGFDCINAHEAVTFEDCWAYANGLSARGEPLADGNGFKAGGYGSTPAERLPRTIPRHVVRGCVAAGNRANGFYANHHPGGCDWFANSAFRNGANFNLLGRLADNRTDVPGSGHRLRDNLGLGSRNPLVQFDPATNEADHNAFAPEQVVAARDLLGVDESQLLLPRQADGSLPAIAFLHLAAGSALVDAGVDVGRPFTGAAPDLGAFER